MSEVLERVKDRNGEPLKHSPEAIVVDLPERFDVKEGGKNSQPDIVAHDFFEQKQPDRIELTGGHFTVTPVQVENGVVVEVPDIYSDIPVSAKIHYFPDEEEIETIVAQYEIPLPNARGEWEKTVVEKSYTYDDWKKGRTSALIAYYVALGNKPLAQTRELLASGLGPGAMLPDYGTYPVYTFARSLDVYKEAREYFARTGKQENISYSVIINDWEDLVGGITSNDGGRVAFSDRFRERFSPSDLVSFLEMQKVKDVHMDTPSLIYEKGMRNRVARYLKDLAHGQNTGVQKSRATTRQVVGDRVFEDVAGEEMYYPVYDSRSDQEIRFGVCGSGACNSEVMQISHELTVGKCASPGERVVLFQFVPKACFGKVDTGVQFGFKFAQKRIDDRQQSNLPEKKRKQFFVPAGMSAVNYYDPPVDEEMMFDLLNHKKGLEENTRRMGVEYKVIE